jgi:hypothetical protein
MNKPPGREPGPRPTWPRRARVAAVITVTAAAALLAAACSGSPSSTGPSGSPNAGGSANSQALAYTQCMRAHGVPDFPDPTSNGQIPKQEIRQLEVGASRLQAAGSACQNLLPAGQAPLTAQEQRDYLKAAACMRSHGITNFPDPVFPGGRVHFPIPAGIDTSSTQFTQARRSCEKLIPAGLPYSGQS